MDDIPNPTELVRKLMENNAWSSKRDNDIIEYECVVRVEGELYQVETPILAIGVYKGEFILCCRMMKLQTWRSILTSESMSIQLLKHDTRLRQSQMDPLCSNLFH